VDETYERDLLGLNLRGTVGLATRCVRRMLPTLLRYEREEAVSRFRLSSADLRACDEVAAMAESFAAGEPGSVFRARRVAERVEPFPGADEQSVEHRSILSSLRSVERSERSWEVSLVFSVGHLGWSAVHSFAAVSRTPPLEEDCHKAYEAAKLSAQYARQTIKFGDSKPELTLKLFDEALQRDRRALLETNSGRVTDVGLPVEVSARGDLGSVWPLDKTPRWYHEFTSLWRPSRDLVITPGRDFLAEKSDLPPDFVFWYVRPTSNGRYSDAQLGEVQEQIRQVLAGGTREQPAPPLIVVAPDIGGKERENLVSMGAIVFTQSPDPRTKIDNDETCQRAIAIRFQNAFAGWERTDQGLWQYTDARTSWRSDELLLSRGVEVKSNVGEPHVRNATEDSDHKLTADDYGAVLKYFKSEDGMGGDA
jgi:hypothetical protein